MRAPLNPVSVFWGVCVQEKFFEEITIESAFIRNKCKAGLLFVLVSCVWFGWGFLLLFNGVLVNYWV